MKRSVRPGYGYLIYVLYNEFWAYAGGRNNIMIKLEIKISAYPWNFLIFGFELPKYLSTLFSYPLFNPFYNIRILQGHS